MIASQKPIIQWTNEEQSILSDIQMSIFQMKVSGETVRSITQKYNLCISNVYVSVLSTIRGDRWTPGESKGGCPSYLGDVEKSILKQEIINRAIDMNCAKTIEVIQTAIELREKRYNRAKFLIKCLENSDFKPKSYEELLKQLFPYAPSSSWITNFSKSNNLIIKNPITIEEARRKNCNFNNVNDFYAKNYEILSNTHPRLIWNADESSHSSTRQFKVLTGNDLNSFSSEGRCSIPHITTMFCYNAQGERMKPFVIIPKIDLLPFPFLSDFNAYFATQSNGWMTKTLFSVWAIHFVSELNLIRLTLPPEIRNKKAVLILDNHSSRVNSFAIEFLNKHNIKVITLPAHCSHVLQPFDVGCAACLKAKITKAKLLNDEQKIVRHFVFLSTKIARARYGIVSAIINAWFEIPLSTLQNSWEKAGIFPFNPQKGLTNPLTNKTVIPVQTNNRFSIANSTLTDDEMRLKLANKCYDNEITNVDEIPKPNYDNFKLDFKINVTQTQGVLLSVFPNIIDEVQPNNFQIVFEESISLQQFNVNQQ